MQSAPTKKPEKLYNEQRFHAIFPGCPPVSHNHLKNLWKRLKCETRSAISKYNKNVKATGNMLPKV